MIRPTEFNLMASVNVICFQCALSDLHWLTILHRRGGYKLRHTPPQRMIQTQAHSTKTPTITHNASHANKRRHISHKKRNISPGWSPRHTEASSPSWLPRRWQQRHLPGRHPPRPAPTHQVWGCFSITSSPRTGRQLPAPPSPSSKTSHKILIRY